MVEYVNALVALYGSDEAEGQGLVEYALIIVLVSIAVFTALGLLGTKLDGVFKDITGKL